MIKYFSTMIEEDIKKHALEVFPDECCGIIVDDNYIPLQNIAENPHKSFRIDPQIYINYDGRLQCIVHSHCDEIIDGTIYKYNQASKKDIEMQINCGIPYGICYIDHMKNVKNIFYFGDTLEIQDLIGREYIYGVYDCYTTLRDYYRKELNIHMDNFPRDKFWTKGPTPIDSLYDIKIKPCGFVENNITLKTIKENDVVLFNIESSCINHCGVYIGNGLFLHHMYGCLSRRDPLMIYRDFISKIVRHKDFI